MAEKRKLAVVAVGGNALIRERGQESIADQYAAAGATMPHIVDMEQNGWDVIVTHGNGPQIGFILRRSDLAAHEMHRVPLDSLTVADAKKYLAEGQFGKGSMEPKIKAVLYFLERGGKKALVTNPDNMLRALAGETGTHFS